MKQMTDSSAARHFAHFAAQLMSLVLFASKPLHLGICMRKDPVSLDFILTVDCCCDQKCSSYTSEDRLLICMPSVTYDVEPSFNNLRYVQSADFAAQHKASLCMYHILNASRSVQTEQNR
ncbi:hypothetical protein Tsp_04743 [Trichinella spiralis]|uniref:hypothetical protein n=1 Tax=Trichinella spiralis TaxID=6334 RepID=UPI0001EFDBE6|nr:hypothetical protein Tsp_04743 [Trichinella spiralis]